MVKGVDIELPPYYDWAGTEKVQPPSPIFYAAFLFYISIVKNSLLNEVEDPENPDHVVPLASILSFREQNANTIMLIPSAVDPTMAKACGLVSR